MKKIEAAIVEYLSPLDLFSTPFNFTFKRADHYSNKKSIGCSLITILLSLFISMYSLGRYFEFKTPLVTVQQEYRMKDDRYFLEAKSNIFGFSLWQTQGLGSGPVGFSLKGENVLTGIKMTGTHESDVKPTALNKIVECSKLDLTNAKEDLSHPANPVYSLPESITTDEAVCVDLKEPIPLSGDFIIDGFSEIGVGSFTIDNCSVGNACEGGNPIYTFVVNYRNNLPDIWEDSGFKTLDRVERFDIDLRKDYDLAFTYQLNKFVSDDNLIFDFIDRTESKNMSLVNLTLKEKDTKNDSTSTSIQINIQLHELVNSYSRTQYKLDNAWANIDAMLKILLTVSQTFIHVMNYGEFDYKIAKTLANKGIIHTNSKQKVKKSQFDTLSLVFCKGKLIKNNPLYLELIDKFEEIKELDYIYENLKSHNRETVPANRHAFNPDSKVESNRDLQSNNFILK